MTFRGLLESVGRLARMLRPARPAGFRTAAPRARQGRPSKRQRIPRQIQHAAQSNVRAFKRATHRPVW